MELTAATVASSPSAPAALATETPATGPAPGEGCAGSGEPSFSIQTQKKKREKGEREKGEKLRDKGGREGEREAAGTERASVRGAVGLSGLRNTTHGLLPSY